MLKVRRGKAEEEGEEEKRRQCEHRRLVLLRMFLGSLPWVGATDTA